MEDKQACKEIIPLLSAYFDNELLPDELLKVNQHLNNCPHCTEELKAIENLSRLLKDFAERQDEEVPCLTNDVMSRLCKENPLLCKNILEETENYFMGKLDLKRHYLIQEHLDDCPNCTRIYNQFEF